MDCVAGGTRKHGETAGDCTVILLEERRRGATDDTWMWNAIQHLCNLGQRETCAGGIVDIRTGTEKIGERAVLMRIQKRQMGTRVVDIR